MLKFKASQLIIIDVKVPSNMINFTDITESIHHIRLTSKQEGSVQRLVC